MNRSSKPSTKELVAVDTHPNREDPPPSSPPELGGREPATSARRPLPQDNPWGTRIALALAFIAVAIIVLIVLL